MFGLILALIPTEIFVGMWLILQPTTFWQKLILIIIGTVFLLPIQVWLGITGLAVTIALTGEKHRSTITKQTFKSRIGKF